MIKISEIGRVGKEFERLKIEIELPKKRNNWNFCPNEHASVNFSKAIESGTLIVTSLKEEIIVQVVMVDLHDRDIQFCTFAQPAYFRRLNVTTLTFLLGYSRA